MKFKASLKKKKIGDGHKHPVFNLVWNDTEMNHALPICDRYVICPTSERSVSLSIPFDIKNKHSSTLQEYNFLAVILDVHMYVNGNIYLFSVLFFSSLSHLLSQSANNNFCLLYIKITVIELIVTKYKMFVYLKFSL